MTNFKLFAAARTAAGMSVKELAATAGVGESAIRKIEGGSGGAAADVLLRLYSTFGIRVDLDSGILAFPMPANSHPAVHLVIARAAAGLTQSDLAALSGVSLRTISAIEKGTGNATTANLDAITSSLKRQGIVIQADPVSDGTWTIRTATVDDDQTDHEIPNEGEDYMENLKRIPEAVTYPDPDDMKPRMKTLRVEMGEVDPPIWRKISLPQNATFSDLHAAIQIAFAWKDKYSHEFRCGVAIGSAERDPEDPMFIPDMVDERTIRLNQVSPHTDEFVYRYGKGEHWIATITEVASSQTYSAHPVVTDGAGAHPPEEAWAEQWNDLANQLRTKTADEDSLNWLQYLGFGRNYDPDEFDIDAVNDDLAAAGFDIATSWRTDFKRRQMLRDAADRLLPKVLPRAPDKARPPSGAFSVTKVESIGQVDVIANHAHGMTVTRSGKSGIAHVRHSHDGLVRVLDLCSDVPEFKTFPFAIHWEEGKRKGVFQPDFSVSDPTGETVVIHVAYDDDEAKFALAVAKGTSLKMKVVRADIMDDPMTKLVLNMLATAKLAWNGRDAGVATTLGVARGTKSIPISQAVKLLTIAGYGRAEHGFAFGTTEERATSCLAAAIANGSVGFDFGRSQVGDPKLTGETCLFWPLVSRHQIR